MKFTPEQVVHCKKLWVAAVLPKAIADDIDESNLGKKHLIGIEGAAHPKTGQLKTLVEEYGDWMANEMPKEIIEAAMKEQLLGKSIIDKTNIQTPRRCAFADWCLTHKIEAHNKYSLLCPSLSAYTRSLPNKEALRQQYMAVQNPEDNIDRLARWDNKPSTFSCTALRHYAEKIGLAHICRICQNRRVEYGKRITKLP